MKKRKEITIINYDAGNIFNLKSSLEKMNSKIIVTNNPKKIIKAEKIIIPGVGAFKEGIYNLKKRKLFYPLKEFLLSEKPILGICLGMQYLMEDSYEFNKNKTPGFSYFKGSVIKFNEKRVKRLTHIGWNYVNFIKNKIFKNIKQKSAFYYCHSYYAKPKNNKNIIGKTDYYGMKFCSVINYKNVYGCQFHPERSGPAGAKFLKNFINL